MHFSQVLLGMLFLLLLSCAEEDGHPDSHYRIELDQQSLVVNGETYMVTILEAQRLPLSPRRFFAIGVDYEDFELTFGADERCRLLTDDYGDAIVLHNTTQVIYEKKLHTIPVPVDDVSFEELFLKLTGK